MACEYCEIIRRERKSRIIYEDEVVIAVLKDKPAFWGHTIVMPKPHFTIIESVPDDVLMHVAVVVQKISFVVSKCLNMHSFTVIGQNGIAADQTVPHFCYNIIPRRADDKLDISWKGKSTNLEELDNLVVEFKKYLIPTGSQKKHTSVQDQSNAVMPNQQMPQDIPPSGQSISETKKEIIKLPPRIA